MIRQILCSLPTYPDAPTSQTLEGAALLAQFLEASLTAQIPQLSSDQATWPTVIGTFPLDFPRMMNETVVASEKNAGELTEALTKHLHKPGRSAGHPQEPGDALSLVRRAGGFGAPARSAGPARSRNQQLRPQLYRGRDIRHRPSHSAADRPAKGQGL